MSQIITIDGKRHHVKETREEIYSIINSLECLDVGVVPLNIRYSISGFKDGQEYTEFIYQPVSFMKNGIIMYY
jgi:hypothetical protein